MRRCILVLLFVGCDEPGGSAREDASLGPEVTVSLDADTSLGADTSVDSEASAASATDTVTDVAAETVEDGAATTELDTIGEEIAVETVEDVALETLEDIEPDVPDVPEPVTYPQPCDSLYDQDTLPTFAIDISQDEWDAMAADCQAGEQRYRPITFRHGADAVAAKMRLKGNWSWSCDKFQFVVSFNEDDPQGRYKGLRKMMLDAPWYDPTVLRERLAMDFLGRYGAPYSCVNNARVVINGEFYGVYANIERLDREYLERHFDDPSGNLYEAGQELKTNEDEPDTSDIQGYWGAETVAELGAITDLEHAVKVWAGEAMIPDLDGYWAGVDINWYIYNHPARGFLYLTYDADISFAENIWPEAVTADPLLWQHTGWGREPQLRMVLSELEWCEAFVDALRDARLAYDVTLMQAQVDTWAAQIAEAVAADEHKTFSLEEHLQSVAALKVFIAARAEFIDDWLGETHCPVDWGD